ncbi:histidine phosphatase family protein [Ruminococcaceae bacterium OttesenSCG-928-N02]|nr:histidine phosphatase family protein [Ruminococcaceae bacterium OttesenSCG-928-N02]
MKNYRIHLIRHGFTQDNEAGILGGAGRDLPLSALGKAEILRMKEEFTYPSVETLFVSPMKRAVETAQLLYPQHKALLIAPLVETHFGPFEGVEAAQVATTGFWETWRDEENPQTPDGAESYAAFFERVTTAYATLLEGMMKAGVHEAALVSHGGVIATILGRFGLPQHHEDFWLADNGAGYTTSISTAMWQRLGMVEVTQILPTGYMQALQAQAEGEQSEGDA